MTDPHVRTDPALPTDNLPQPGSRRPRIWPWYAGAVGLLALDQVTKWLIRSHLDLHQSIPVIGQDFVRLTYVLNPGIAFGMTILGLTPLLFFGWAAAIVLAVYLRRLVIHRDPLRWPVLLFLAGAAGNSIDRLIFGRVTDFVDMDFPDFIMERFAVFNVADSCITVGIAILLLVVFFGHHSRTAPAAGESAAVAPDPQPSSSPNADAQRSSSEDSVSPDDRPGPTASAD
jgi:signal peptidase II